MPRGLRPLESAIGCRKNVESIASAALDHHRDHPALAEERGRPQDRIRCEVRSLETRQSSVGPRSAAVAADVENRPLDGPSIALRARPEGPVWPQPEHRSEIAGHRAVSWNQMPCRAAVVGPEECVAQRATKPRGE